MTTRKPSNAALAADAWRNIFDFIVRTVDQRNRILAELALTPNESRAIGSLDLEAGRTMRTLAREWRCDASTATWIVDRLEAKGLARRQAHPTDRRVKLVVLTARGEETRNEMLERTYTPPPELLELDRAELTALRDASAPLGRLAGPSGEAAPATPSTRTRPDGASPRRVRSD